MADCEYLVSCPFFNDTLAKMPAVAEWLKSQYCRGDYSECARLLVREALGPENVPADLYPNEQKRARQIISIPRL